MVWNYFILLCHSWRKNSGNDCREGKVIACIEAHVRPNDKTPSIMVAPYPMYEKEFDDPIAASQYEQIIASVKAARSLLDAYSIKQDAKSILLRPIWSNLVIIEVEPSLKTLFDEQLQSISQLIGTKKIESIGVTTENTDEGYAVSTVSSEINVLLLVKGRIDLASHLEKTKERLSKAQEKLGKLTEQMGAAGYKDKVDSDIKEADDERLRNLTAEVETLDAFVASLEKLTLQ